MSKNVHRIPNHPHYFYFDDTPDTLPDGCLYTLSCFCSDYHGKDGMDYNQPHVVSASKAKLLEVMQQHPDSGLNKDTLNLPVDPRYDGYVISTIKLI